MSDPINWTQQRKRLGDLTPWPRNPRQIKSPQAKRLLQSVQEFGQVETLAIGPDGDIYNGHQRLAVLMERYGADYEVDVRVSSRPLTEKEREKLTVYLHKGAAGEWDFDILANEFEVSELIEWGFDAAELGIDPREDSGIEKSESVIYSQEQIIDAAFMWFRANGFPYRNLAPHVSMQEINKLLQTEPDNLINTDTAYHVADTYHPHRFHTSAEGMKSPYDSFFDDDLLRRAMRLNQENGYTLPQEAFGQMWIVSGTQVASNFRPGFASFLYRKYCPANATVLDTSTGYGGRLVGFIASGLDGFYIGIDPNTETHAGNLRMAQELGFSDRVELHNLPAEDVAHDAVAGRCDFAFTSPPYFRKEHYSDEDTQSWVRYQTGDEWRDGFLRPMMTLQYAALKPGCIAIVNIADVKIKNKTYPLAAWTEAAGKDAGFTFIQRDEFPLTRRFGAGMADEVATEPVLVFQK